MCTDIAVLTLAQCYVPSASDKAFRREIPQKWVLSIKLSFPLNW